MVATVTTKGKNKGQAVTPAPETNGTSETNGTPAPTGLEAGKTYTVKEYRAATGFNMSGYLREQLTIDPNLTTEDVIAKLAEEHPQLVYKKDAIGQVLSNTKTAMRNGPGGGKKTNDNVTMDDIVKAKDIVRENGGIEVLLSALENYRKFKTLADAFGGEEKAVKVLELMEALRAE